MLKNLSIIILYSLVALTSRATNLLLTVKDRDSKLPLQAVSVRIESSVSNTQSITDALGRAAFQSIEFPLVIHAKTLGYQSVQLSLKASHCTLRNDTAYYTLILEPSVSGLRDVVVTGQAGPVLAQQSIYKVNTINASQIAKLGAVTLNDVLNFELNNFVNNDNVLGSSVNMGGLSGQNIKILINGIPLTGRENGNIDLGQINLNNIKRVEMIQGPMSVVYGSNAMGGVINLITQTPKKNHSGGVRSYFETVGRYNFNGHYNYGDSTHQLMISAARNFFQGWTPKDSGDRFQLWKPKTQYTADIQYNYQLSKNVKLNYFGSYLNEKITNKGTPIINPYEGYAFDEYYRTHRIINAINGDIKLSSKSNFVFTNNYTNYNRTKNRFKKDLVSLNQFETLSRGDQDTSTFNTLHLRGVYHNQQVKNTDIQLGYEYTHETGLSYKLADDKQQLQELGLFGSALYQYKRLSVQPSARLTANSRYKTALTPALHLKYNVGKNNTLRMSYAKGYRTPSLKELYLQFIDQNHTILGNENLSPELGTRIELIAEKIRPVQNGEYTYSLSLNHNNIKNLITLAGYNNHGILRIYDNVESYKNYNANIRIGFRNDRWTSQIGSGIIHVLGSSLMPQHQIVEASATLAYLLKKYNTSFNVNYKFNSLQPILTIDQQFVYTDPMHIANTSVQTRFFKNTLLLQVGIKNMFNIQTSPLNGVGIMQGGHMNTAGMQLFPERSFFMDISYTF